MSVTTAPLGNLWAQIKQFSSRGGFDNGLDPSVTGRIWYVDTINGSDGNTGLAPGQGGAFATMARAFEFIDSYDTIVLNGVVREQLTAPLGVFDITILGGANTPRQATSSGTPTGGGSTWLAPTSPTAATPLLTIREQGWTLANFFMAAHTDAACVQCRTAEDATYPSAGHFASYGMIYGGGLYGIQDVGGLGFARIIGNNFRNIDGATAYAIRNTSTAVANPLQWYLCDNVFRTNKNHVLAPLSQSVVTGNDFGIVGNTVTAVIALSLTGGLNNSVYKNAFNRPVNTSPNATLYVGGTNDLWYENYGTDAIFYGVPDNS